MMSPDSKTAIVSSSLWAAYGDALGFISELADSRTLAFRIKAKTVNKTVRWKRRIGGRFGVVLELPSGCYSDDTQLRLATSRAIRADGHFDVEAFAKIELPVWLCYSLGGGLSTKAAASSLIRENVNWFSNFFSDRSSSYFDAGGNGASMRIQPHVWAASDFTKSSSYMKDVIRNSVCTHGHPNALAGAFFHASCLASTLATRELPGPRQWRETISRFPEILSIIRADDELNTFWLPVWRQRTKCDMEVSLQKVQQESLNDILAVERYLGHDDSVYPRIVEAIGGLEPATRGSGIKTAILAAALGWLFKGKSISDALIEAANVLGSDTDSIATMAGAVLGAVSKSKPEGDLADREYIETETLRLYDVGRGAAKDSFRYPDLMSWRAPKTLSSAVDFSAGQTTVAGLGPAQAIGESRPDRKDESVAWQWLKLSFGQTILAKLRKRPGNLSDEEQSSHNTVRPETSPKRNEDMSSQSDMFNEPQNGTKKEAAVSGVSLDELTNTAISSGFDQELIGKHLVQLAETSNGVELAVAYAAIIVKAKRARLRLQAKKDRETT
jgi:ADP-ribosylglycohydrolase